MFSRVIHGFLKPELVKKSVSTVLPGCGVVHGEGSGFSICFDFRNVPPVASSHVGGIYGADRSSGE